MSSLRNRTLQTTAVAAPPAVPDGPAATVLGPVAGRYLGSTTAGNWLDRIADHDLGTPTPAALTVRDDGVLIARDGADDVFVPQAALRGARLDQAIAGNVYRAGGVLVLTWRNGCALDTGFRAADLADHGRLVEALATIRPGGSGGSGT